MFFLAFAIKIPIVPFHTWQADTYRESPTQGTMLLSGIMLKMGTYSLIRWLLPILPLGVAKWGPLAITLCAGWNCVCFDHCHQTKKSEKPSGLFFRRARGFDFRRNLRTQHTGPPGQCGTDGGPWDQCRWFILLCRYHLQPDQYQ